LHGSIERLYLAWIKSGRLGIEEAQLLLSQTTRLKQLYSVHIQVEETIVFARASQVLDSHAIEAIGTEFRFRRK
jgi:hemerythrin-like domain-containing protein